jgi:hypothetical protein
MIEVYQGRDKDWYWRQRKKGRITADGSEGYATKYNARRAARRIGASLMFDRITEVTVSYGRGKNG